MGRGRPAIGITCDLAGDGKIFLRAPYPDAVSGAGGLPVLLPPVRRVAEIDGLLGRVDGLLLSGADDYDPRRYGAARRHPRLVPVAPRRERFDLAIARRAIRRGIPVLGICGGAQLIAIALGGTLRQHLARHPTRGARHAVAFARGSRLATLAGRRRARVNSFHHQAVRRPGAGLAVTARAGDGVIEGIEGAEGFLVGVQWHPEREPERRLSRALFRALVEEAGR